MQLIVRKTKSFILDGHEIFTVNPGSEPLQVPDWVRGTGTFKLAVQDGSITEIGPKPEPQGIYVPSKAEVIAAGYTPEAADVIIARQEELRDVLAGKRPIPHGYDFPPVPPVPVTVTTAAAEKPAGATDDESEASSRGGWSAARRAAQEAKKTASGLGVVG
jgi:hypothetical protein